MEITYPFDDPHTPAAAEILQSFETNAETGLSQAEADNRAKKFGANIFEAQKQKSIWLMFLLQFMSPIVYLLVLGALVSLYFRDYIEAIAIGAWIYPNIFSPVHIIFLELIMWLTCSIIYENEPMEKNTMVQKPRPLTASFFNWKELTGSIVQGLIITAGTLITYQYAVHEGLSESLTRTMVFTMLIAANIFLTLVNRSFYYSVITTMRYKNNLFVLIIGITIAVTTLLITVNPLTAFFEFEDLNLNQLFLCIGIGFLSVIWYEIIKWRKRRNEILI